MAKEPGDLVVCVDNSGYEAALERRKLYALLPDTDAEGGGLLRVADESGEGYLTTKSCSRIVTPARLAMATP